MWRRCFSTSGNSLCSKPWAISKDGVVKCMPLTNQSLDGALKVMRESFLKTESLCKAVGLLNEPGAAEELLQTCCDAAKDGVSIVAKDTNSNEVVGVLFNKIQVLGPKGQSYYEKLRQNCKHGAMKAFVDFTIDIEAKADIFTRYNTNCVMEVMYIATLPDFKQRKIAELLVLSTNKLGKQLYNGQNVKTLVGIEDNKITNAEAIPTLITALTTSNYTQKLGVKFGYENVLEVNFDDYTFDGKKFSERIGDLHKTCRVVVKRLDIE